MRALLIDSELSGCSIRRVLLADVLTDLLQFGLLRRTGGRPNTGQGSGRYDGPGPGAHGPSGGGAPGSELRKASASWSKRVAIATPEAQAHEHLHFAIEALSRGTRTHTMASQTGTAPNASADA